MMFTINGFNSSIMRPLREAQCKANQSEFCRISSYIVASVSKVLKLVKQHVDHLFNKTISTHHLKTNREIIFVEKIPASCLTIPEIHSKTIGDNDTEVTHINPQEPIRDRLTLNFFHDQ